MDYKIFLKNKQIIADSVGFKPTQLNPMLFDFQKAIVEWALIKGRAAIFADCGLGKTPMQLEWADQVCRKTGGRVLILAPLAVSRQTKREGDKFNINVTVCNDRADIKNGVNITNYEKLHKFDRGEFTGIVLDESSILKSYTGKFRNEIISSFHSTPYKLACTATPAPNDFTEIGNHCEFLNILTRSEMLSTFFINDTSNVGTWRLKKHGQSDFWKWVCSWSVMLTKPSDLGYEDNGFILPPIEFIQHEIKSGKPLPGKLFVEPAQTLNERRQARRESILQKCELISDLVKTDNGAWLIWCDLNIESESARKTINQSVEITGSDTDEHKETSMIGFANGDFKILVTKPKIAGFGMNWQHCSNVVFFGLSDSYEQFYQAVRRCWRFGQTQKVTVHIVTSNLEGNIVDNIRRKENDAETMRKEMVKNMTDFMKEGIKHSGKYETEYSVDKYENHEFELYLGDNIEVIKNIKSESVGFSMFSPPFASLFTYSNSNRDMGNCRTKDEFIKHFGFLIPELFRVLMPGRLIAVHCMNLPATISHDGFVGVKDFRGDLIRLLESHGFYFHSEICIWKDPLVQAVRTKVISLAHKQVVKDSSRCAQGLPDYIVVMRKPGDNPKPISRKKGFTEYIGERPLDDAKTHEDQRKNKMSHQIWQRYASPVWFDIRQTRVLSRDIARDDRDEKHVCPLQLDTVERCLELWSAKNDVVLDPFAGIGTVPYCAVKMGRYAIGIELKRSYFDQSIKNINRLQRGGKQMRLI